LNTAMGLNKFGLLGVIVAINLFACDQKPTAGVSSMPSVPPRNFAPEKLALGKKVFEKYCIECHGVNAVGTQNWKKRDSSGKFPPPPLNGSGHAWHHPRSVLKRQIYSGGVENGGSMPAFGDKLNEQEIDSVVDWIQSIWPENVYNAWYEIQHQ